jgi:hypothetical protein
MKVHAPGVTHHADRIMNLINLRKIFSRSPKTLSPPEKREYKEAADEFTSEGAPPVKPRVNAGRTATARKTPPKASGPLSR